MIREMTASNLGTRSARKALLGVRGLIKVESIGPTSTCLVTITESGVGG